MRGFLAVFALTLLSSVVLTSVADACGHGRRENAAHPKGAHGRPPFVIGDSTLEYAVPMLAHLGIEADALVCRQFGAGVSMLAARRHAGTLPRMAILALGANGPIQDSQIRAAMRIMGPNRTLGLVTPPKEYASQAAMRRAARRFPDRVLLVDWVAYSAGGGWFDGDGLHPTVNGARAFTRLVRRSIAPYAFPPVRALHLPRRAARERRCGAMRRHGHWTRVYIVRGANRVRCTRARQLVRGPLLRPAPGWRNYDWRSAPGSAWARVIARRDRSVVIATVPGRWRPARPKSSSATAARQSFTIHTKDGFITRIGGFRVSAGTLAAAISAFGAPTTTHLGRYGVCRVQWRNLRLTGEFVNYGGGGTACEPAYGGMQEATMRGRAFRTTRGIRVGARSSQVPLRHSNATFTDGSWWIASVYLPYGDGSDVGTIRAIVRDGRVRALGLYIGAGGE